MTIYGTHGLRNRNQSIFPMWGREWRRKIFKNWKILVLLTLTKGRQIMSFHHILPVFLSTQYTETQEVLSTISSRNKDIKYWVSFWNINRNLFAGILLNLSLLFVCGNRPEVEVTVEVEWFRNVICCGSIGSSYKFLQQHMLPSHPTLKISQYPVS